MQADVIARIANLDTVGPDALNELEDVMQKKFKANIIAPRHTGWRYKSSSSNNEFY